MWRGTGGALRACVVRVPCGLVLRVGGREKGRRGGGEKEMAPARKEESDAAALACADAAVAAPSLLLVDARPPRTRSPGREPASSMAGAGESP
jgi:hypothetical protein